MPIILFIIFSIVCACPAFGAYVPITVDIGGAQPASNVTMSSGIPFPIGTVSDVSNLRLTDAADTPVAAQFNELVAWPDGSVKVATLSFTPTLSTDGTTYNTYKLVYDNPGLANPVHVNAIQTTDNETQIIINTGVSTFYLSKTTFNVFDQIKIGATDQMSSPGDLVFADGNTGNIFKTSLSTDYSLSVLESGAIKTVVLASGRAKAVSGNNLFAEDTLVTVKLWMTFYANSGRVDFKYTWVDDVPRIGPPTDAAGGSWPAPPNAATVKYVNLINNYFEFPLIAMDSTYTVGGESSIYSGNVDQARYIYQDASKTAWPYPVFTFGYTGVGSGLKAPGWFDLTRSDAGVTVGVRNFWQNYPNKIYADETGLLKIYLQPDESANKTFSIAPGVGKTHDIYLDFHSGTDSTEAAKRALLYNEIPVLYAGAAWYSQSKAFGPISAPDDFSAKWDSETDKLFTCASTKTNCSGYPILYGKRDFGDYMGGYTTLGDGTKLPVYYNQHYEDAHGWILEYLRTGKKKYFNFAVPFAVHHYDLDVMHTTWSEIYPGYPAGMIHFHGSGEHEASKMEPGHIVPGGIDEYFLLTGDPRALEVSKEQGDWVAKYLGDGHGRIAIEKVGDAVLDIEYERAQAWAQYTVIKTFESTNDFKYWDAATIATKNTIDWWRMPNQAIVAYDVAVPIDMGQTPEEQAIYFKALDWTKGNGYFMSTLRSANTEQTSAPLTPSSYWPYQQHVPISWMAAYLESALIRYLENLETMGGSYSNTIAYRSSSETFSVDSATMKDMISQTVKIVADHNFESTTYPSLFPWIATLNNNLWVYSASRERVLSSPTSTDGDYQIPFMLAYVANFGQSDVHTDLQSGWADTQNRLKAIAKLTYDKYVTNYTMPGGNTGYNGAPVVWNMPYALTYMSNSTIIDPDPISGICGQSNGLALSSAPSTGLCTTGTPSAVTGTGPWSWTCAGSGGGSTANCGATLLEVPPTGNAAALVACPVIAGFR